MLLSAFAAECRQQLHHACIRMQLWPKAVLLLLLLPLPPLLPQSMLLLLLSAVAAETCQQLHHACIGMQLRSKAVLPLLALLLWSPFAAA